MKRLVLASLSISMVFAASATSALANPPSGDANPADLFNRTIDTHQIINPHVK